MPPRVRIPIWLEVVRSARWPYLTIGRVLIRTPKDSDQAVFVKIVLDLPNSILRPRVTADVVIPDPPEITAEGTNA